MRSVVVPGGDCQDQRWVNSWLTCEAVGWAMHLRLLGPFEMVVDSGPVHLAGRGERALVTLLGLSPGRVVADTTLIEQLWSTGINRWTR